MAKKVLKATKNDTIPTVNPTVVLTSPNPTTNVSLDTPIIITFSEAVLGVNTTTIQFQTQDGQPQTITISPSSDNSYTLIPSQPLLPSTQYVVLVLTDVSSTNTGLAVVLTSFTFITVNPPTVLLTSPNPTTNVSLTPTVTLTFSEAVTGVNTNTIQFLSQGGTPQTITITPSGNSYTLTLPISGLSRSIQYLVRVNSGITSTTTSLTVVPITFNFSTILSTPPTETTVYTPNTTTLKPIAYASDSDLNRGGIVDVDAALDNATELTQQYGFGTLFSTSEETIGLPPDRLDFNTFLNLITSVVVQQQRGVQFTYNNTLAIYLYNVTGNTQYGYYPPQSVLFDPIINGIGTNSYFIKINSLADTLLNFNFSTNPNWQQITIPPFPSSIQRLKFNDVGTGSTQYLVPPAGATGFFLTATTFGGNGGAGAASGSISQGGGGGAGAGVNNIYFDLPTTPPQYQVQYIIQTGTNPSRLSITTPNGILILYNGSNGSNGGGSGSGGGGSGGTGEGIGIFVTPQILNNGTNGRGGGGGAGGASSLSNGTQVIASGGLLTISSGANGYLGGGGGGGVAGYNFGLGGNAIVIAEWVFP